MEANVPGVGTVREIDVSAHVSENVQVEDGVGIRLDIVDGTALFERPFRKREKERETDRARDRQSECRQSGR